MISTLKKIATAEDTPGNIIQELSKDRKQKIRQAVAENPNTPIEVLVKLSEEFPEAITGNPVFELLILENPDSDFIKLCLASSSTTPQKKLSKLIEDKNSQVRLAVVQNCNTPLEILDRLANNSQEANYIHETIAKNPIVTSEILSKLIVNIDEYWRIRIHQQIVKHPQISALILDQLAHHPNEDIRLKVSQHPLVSDFAIAVIQFIEEKLTPDLSLFQKLVNSPSYYVRLLIIKHPLVTESILEQLANDSNEYVRAKVAQHPNISVKTIYKLAKDRVWRVRVGVAQNQKIPVELLIKLSSDRSKHTRKKWL